MRTGIGNFILADGNVFEDSNQNRQLGATDASLGCYKTEIIKQRILSINSRCHVTAYHAYVTAKNYKTILSEADIICDTVDGNTNKRNILQFGLALKKIIVSGRLSGSCFDYFIIDNFKLSADTIQPKNTKPFLSANPSSLFIQGGRQAQAIIDYLLQRPIQTNVIYRYNSYKI